MSTNIAPQRRMPPVPPGIYKQVAASKPTVSITSSAPSVPLSIQRRIPQPPPKKTLPTLPPALPPALSRVPKPVSTQTAAPIAQQPATQTAKPMPTPPQFPKPKSDPLQIGPVKHLPHPPALRQPKKIESSVTALPVVPQKAQPVLPVLMPIPVMAPLPSTPNRAPMPPTLPRREIVVAGTIVVSVPFEPAPKIDFEKLIGPVPKRVFIPIPLSPKVSPKAAPESVSSAQQNQQEHLTASAETQSLPRDLYRPSSPVQKKPLTVWDEEPLAQRVDRSVKRTKATDIFKAVVNSRIFSAIILPGLALAGLFGVAFLLGLTPPGWMIIAVAVAGFAIGFLFPRGNDLSTSSSLSFEVDAIRKLNTKHEDKFRSVDIFDKPIDTGTLYMGSLPNRADNFGEYLANKKGIGAVLSVDKPQERRAVGVSLPYRFEDWMDLNVSYDDSLHVDDRQLLSLRDLEFGAQFINAHLFSGENVYVSGEVGRQAIMAYLLKYNPWRSLDDAMDMVGESRPEARALLEQYNNQLAERNIYGN